MSRLTTTGHPRLTTRCLSAFLALLLIAQSLLSGCSSSTDPQPKPKPKPEPQSEPVDGSIDTSQIGGSDLKIVSAWEDKVSVGGNGDFTVAVSTSGTQLIFSVDGEDSLRALCLSIPEPEGKAALQVDASSTAMSLIMMTPGILALDPAEAASRTEEIRNLTEFETLTGLLGGRLTTECLSAALRDPDVTSALDQCITAWAETQDEPLTGLRKTTLEAPAFNGCSKFAAGWTDTIPRSYVKTWIGSQSWRYVTVFRRLLDEHSNTVDPDAVGSFDASMPGAIPVNWLCYFRGDCGQPTIWSDHVDFTCLSRVASVEYWARGWGQDPGISLPDGITESDDARNDRVLIGVLDYIILPLFGLFVGFVPVQKDLILMQVAKIIWAETGLARDVASIIGRIASAQHPATFGSELCALVAIVMGFVLFNSAVLAFLGVPSSIYTFVGWIALIFNLAFTTTNLTMVSVSWSRVPKTCKAVVTSPWAGDPCLDWTPPAGVNDLRVVGVTRSSVTLAWTAPGDDGTSGNASFSDIRLATMELNEETWDQAIDVQGEPGPPGAGETATVTVGGLTPTTRYWFAVKTGDEIPNWSTISNVVDTTTTDEPEAMIWDLSFAVSQCTLEQFGCSPQGCFCPPVHTVYGFCPNRRLNVWGMRMESDGQNLHGSMTVNDAAIGSYVLRSGTVAVTATTQGGLASYDLTITGLLDDPFLEPAQNPFAELDCTFSVTDAVVSGNQINGAFLFDYDIDSLAGSCMNLNYREEGWGNSTVSTQMAPVKAAGIQVSSGP